RRHFVGYFNEGEPRGHLLRCDVIVCEITFRTTRKRCGPRNSKLGDRERKHNARPEAETEDGSYSPGFQLQTSLYRHTVERRKGNRPDLWPCRYPGCVARMSNRK